MAVPHLVHETLFLSKKIVETRFLPPSNLSKWRGLRGLVARLAGLAPAHDVLHRERVHGGGEGEGCVVLHRVFGRVRDLRRQDGPRLDDAPVQRGLPHLEKQNG